MKKFKLTKIVASLLLTVSALTINPIEASANEWRQSYNGDWCLYDNAGNAMSGWVEDDGNWYFIVFKKMMANRYVDGYYLGDNGAWTTNDTVIKYDGYSVNPSDVEATSQMYNKLLKEGSWVKRGVFALDDYHWYDAKAELYLPNKDGAEYNTACWIQNGFATVHFVTNCQNFDEYKGMHMDDYASSNDYLKARYADLTLEQYLNYKKEGKIGSFLYYIKTVGSTVAGQGAPCIQEYLIKDKK